MRIFGLDLSLDHGGVVCLNKDGSVLDYCFFTSIKKFLTIDPDHAILLSKRGKEESKDTFRLRRMKEYLEKLMEFEHKVSTSLFSSYYAIEGYSYLSQTTSICQIAELTGYLKYALFEGGGSIRIHDPLSVKLFATGIGNCSKKDIVKQARFNFNIPEGLIKKVVKKSKKKGVQEEFDGPGTDIADSYFLARMLYMELQVRQGSILLDQLSEGERRVFLRVTKAHPVNLLDRKFIQKG